MINLSVRLLTVVVLGTLVLGISMGIAWQYSYKPSAVTAPHTDDADKIEKKPTVLYWYDPMVPDQHFDKPGKSPFMDMELVPKYAEPASTTPGLSINPALVQNLGMRKAKVQRLPVQSMLEVVGHLQFNERDQAIIQLRAAGFVEKVWPLAVGDLIESGQPIAELQVPAWLDAQNELLAQLVDQNPLLLATLRTRLQLLGMPESLIAKVEKTRQPETRIVLISPITGVMDMLVVKFGMTMASGDTLAKINGLDTLWLDAVIPEAQVSLLRVGDKAIFYSADPGDPPLSGSLEYLLPFLDGNSRTLTARIVLQNPEWRLKPGTSGRVLLQSSSVDEAGLFVPTEAVIRTGKRVLVMLTESGGSFRPVEVIAGNEQGSLTRILHGVEDGQEVIASGQFLLDSEASFLGIAPKTAEGHDHD